MNNSTTARQKHPAEARCVNSFILLCLYLRAVPEGDRDVLVPTDRGELDHATTKAAIKLADGAVLHLFSFSK